MESDTATICAPDIITYRLKGKMVYVPPAPTYEVCYDTRSFTPSPLVQWGINVRYVFGVDILPISCILGSCVERQRRLSGASRSR